MRATFGTRQLAWLLLALPLLLTGCGYNQVQSEDEKVKAAWAEVVNQYKRRADLVPNLVSVVEGYAVHEKEVLTRVTEARSRVGSLAVTPELLQNEEAMQHFAAAQGELGSALGRLLAVAENYPQLKADTLFRDLQAQLEGTENRIAVARRRYIQAVQAYNTLIRTFPTSLTALLFHYPVKPTFSVENEAQISEPPPIHFPGPSPGASSP
ncbi:LemA family protein [Methylacidimicrobium sp. B4]|uniref:LemA family protein n=1 Tax=Methylacidimicrobium sp. B4 TaxID=2796139 RepID=UPI001A8E689E|nr:LemA family protein [Methylacidimicrobium sp. B4]QSR85724.1 LemA family protein [Methylacidimicrobium sp. B4]